MKATRFHGFPPAHAARLRRQYASPAWREARRRWLAPARRRLATPPETENVFGLPVEQLLALNEARVRELIAAGERDEERLLAALGTWPEQWPEEVPVRLSFLGLNLGFACDMQPRCVYCNQRPVPEAMGAEDWKGLLRGLTPTVGKGAYVFLTGGEPLLWGEALWGQAGLIRAAGKAGAACNLNTNALGLSPRAALELVSSGLRRIHISLDSHRPEVQDAIHQRRGRWAQVMRGLRNLQIAKALLGATHPVIHLNCVLTNLNAWDFPEFLRFLVGMKPLPAEGLSPDLDLHLIPVGGERNAYLRLTAAEYERFFSETWDAADAVWQEYQAARGIPEDQRGKLHEKLPFLSPYHRVQQRGTLGEWAATAAAGRPAGLALAQRCYVAATQGFVLPDGSQFWCGGHATSRPEPVGNVRQQTVADNIRQGLGQLAALPRAECRSCPGATQAINQNVEARLRQLIAEWLNPQEPAAAAAAGDQSAFE